MAFKDFKVFIFFKDDYVKPERGGTPPGVHEAFQELALGPANSNPPNHYDGHWFAPENSIEARFHAD